MAVQSGDAGTAPSVTVTGPRVATSPPNPLAQVALSYTAYETEPPASVLAPERTAVSWAEPPMATEEADSWVEMVGVLGLPSGWSREGRRRDGTVGTGRPGAAAVGEAGGGGAVEPLGAAVVGSGEGVGASALTVIGSAAQLLDTALLLPSPE